MTMGQLGQRLAYNLAYDLTEACFSRTFPSHCTQLKDGLLHQPQYLSY